MAGILKAPVASSTYDEELSIPPIERPLGLDIVEEVAKRRFERRCGGFRWVALIGWEPGYRLLRYPAIAGFVAMNLQFSALSRRVKDLELRLGVTLFHRYPGGVRVTAAGDCFLAKIRRILKDLDDTLQGLESAGHGDSHSRFYASIIPSSNLMLHYRSARETAAPSERLILGHERRQHGRSYIWPDLLAAGLTVEKFVASRL
ncbi:LysR family transcriptional regulator [Mesorhizobium sp. ArgA1]